MAISQKQYAAEFFDSEGEVYLFDEVGCLRNFVTKSNVKPAAIFVKDFDSRRWLDGNQAVYVRSEEFDTPMSGHIVAFKDKQAAKTAASKYSGAVIPLW